MNEGKGREEGECSFFASRTKSQLSNTNPIAQKRNSGPPGGIVDQFSNSLASSFHSEESSVTMLILSLCREEHHEKLISGYAAAFRRRGIDLHCVEGPLAFDASLDELVRQCPRKPSWIFQFDSDYRLMPNGLATSEIPTVCFRTDIYTYTSRQMRWSSLFDHVAIFHPGYPELFHTAGHLGAFLLPWAVRREFFEGPELWREYEVGWVGQTKGPLYQKRAAILPKLASTFHINDWSRTYSLSEVADLYRRSRVVVNIGRDDFPQDANMRVFEVLASGALLVTRLPTELTELGFQERVHFIGYREEAEIVPLVQSYLRRETEIHKITNAARTQALKDHTYDARVEQLMRHLEQYGSRKLAPARQWSEHRVRLIYLDFFSSAGLFEYCLRQFRNIVGRGVRETIEGGFLLIKAWVNKSRFPHRPRS